MESLRVTVPEIWAGQNRGEKKRKKKIEKRKIMNIDNPIQHPLRASLIIIIIILMIIIIIIIIIKIYHSAIDKLTNI